MVVFNFAKWFWINTKSQKDEYGEFFASFIPEKKPKVCRLSCDGDYKKNVKTFAGYYAQIIQKIKKMQPRAKFFLVSMPNEGANEYPEKRKKHRDLLEEMTRFFDRTYLIDLFTYAPEYDEEFKKKFFLGHMTPTGYVLTARMIESYIDYIIRKNPEDFAQVGFIGTDLYFQPEE